MPGAPSNKSNKPVNKIALYILVTIIVLIFFIGIIFNLPTLSKHILKDHYIVTLSDNYGHVLGYYICGNTDMNTLENKLSNVISNVLINRKTWPVSVHLGRIVLDINNALEKATSNTTHRICWYPPSTNAHLYASWLGKDSLVVISYDTETFSNFTSMPAEGDYYELFFLAKTVKTNNSWKPVPTYTLVLEIHDIKFYIMLSLEAAILLLLAFILGDELIRAGSVDKKYKLISLLLAGYIAIVNAIAVLKWYLLAYRGGLWFVDLMFISMALTAVNTATASISLPLRFRGPRIMVKITKGALVVLPIVIIGLALLYINTVVKNVSSLLFSFSGISSLKTPTLAQIALIFTITLTLMPLGLESTEAQRVAYGALMSIAILSPVAVSASSLWAVGASAGELLGAIIPVILVYALLMVYFWLSSR